MRAVKVIMVWVLFLSINKGYSQRKMQFYENRYAWRDLKQSLSNALNSYPDKKGVGARNFFTVLNSDYFDSALFYRAIDTIKKYDKGSFKDFYVIIYNREGETAVTKVFFRAYSKHNGIEVNFYLLPLQSRDGMVIRNYSHDNCIFQKAINMKFIPDLPESNDLLSISVFKKGVFTTKIYKANNLPPEYFNRIQELLRDDF